MSIQNNIRAALGNFRFKKEVEKSKQKHEVVGFEEARNIGLLYDATDQFNFEIIKAYVKSVRSLQKDVLALGYVDRKVLPQNQYAQYGLDFFTRKSLNWQ